MKLSNVYRGRRVYVAPKNETRREAYVMSGINNWTADDHVYHIKQRSDARGVALMVRRNSVDWVNGKRVVTAHWYPEVRSAVVLIDAVEADREAARLENNARIERERREAQRAHENAERAAAVAALPLEAAGFSSYTRGRLTDGRDIYVTIADLARFADAVRAQADTARLTAQDFADRLSAAYGI